MDTKVHTNLGVRIKELRNNLGLTQEGLAKKAGVSYATLIKIESGAIKNSSLKIVEKIAQALEVQIENLTGHTSIVKIISEQDCIAKLLDDVYTTLKQSKGEVYISGIDERNFLAADRKAILAHISRLTKANIRERLLAREGDTYFFSGPQSIYRWVPENMFNPTPIYVYGNKLAMIVWGPPQQIIVIENFALADAYRKQFLFIWERAQIPPSKKVVEDERKRLEQSITNRFGGQISPLSIKDRKIFRDFLVEEKARTYGNSFYYLCQAANGIGAEKIGLKYFDGEMLATIGIFNRASLGGGWHFHIVHPMGKFNEKKLLTLAQSMLELSGNPVYIKKITKEQQDKLLNSGFTQIERYSWHSQSLEEDDTFPEQVIDIEETLRQINGITKSDLQDKYHRFYSKYGDLVKFEDVLPINMKDAEMIVDKFFQYLEVKELHISKPSDYYNLIHCPPLGKNNKTYFSQILYVNKKPYAFFAAEPISPNTVGLYANITLYQELPYISEYLIVYICQVLHKKGYRFLNLGGSETAGLFQFKDKFTPVEYNKMHWVVYKL